MNVIKCDCCGKIMYGKSNKLILPVEKFDEEICSYQGKELCRTKLKGGYIEPEERDICPTCQIKIARFCNMLGYVDINIDKIELNIFDKFKEEIVNCIRNNMENR